MEQVKIGKSMEIRAWARFVIVVALCKAVLFFGVAHADFLPGVTIVSPKAGAFYFPHDDVNIEIKVDPTLIKVRELLISTKPDTGARIVLSNFWRGRFSDLRSFASGVVTPVRWSGPMEVIIKVRTIEGKLIEGPTVTVHVKPREVPVRVEATKKSVTFNWPLKLKGLVKHSELYGYYPDGVRRIIGSGLGTTYTSSNPSVATVEGGEIRPQGPGITYVTMSNNGMQDYCEVRIVDSNNPDIRPIDNTSQATIIVGSLEKDTVSDFYVQQITLHNDSSLPIPYPVILVIANLPPQVLLNNTQSKTQNIAPLDSPVLSLNIKDRNFWRPGSATSITLEFSNPEDVPITYTPKVYTTWSP